ncbi:MAG: LytTR family DNA-binding domain-containing protein [Clostridiales bacterium]|nr:LytTR family DNA-binding domain-containing protein [Clostridiales bacterium]
MLHILICEDDPKQRKRMETICRDYIAMTDHDIKLALSTDNPAHLLGYLEANPQTNGLYFLDIDLQHQINGIVLASKIRKLDTYGKIVFATAHTDLAPVTFQYKVEALDYIVKDKHEHFAEKVRACIELSYQQYIQRNTTSKRHYQIKTGDEVLNIPLEDILYFESHHIPHKLILHTENSRIECYASLSKVAELSSDFYRCHQSFVVNVKNIKRIDKAKKEIEMTNGAIALLAAKKTTQLLELMNE